MVACPYGATFDDGVCWFYYGRCQLECLRSESESGSDVYGITASTETGAVCMVDAGALRSQ